MRHFDPRYRLWLIALALLVGLPLFAGFAGLGWELAQGAGLLGLIGCLFLCGAPLRPREAEPPTLLSLATHTALGWIALGAVLVHIGGLALADRTVIEYLKPSMPLYQWAALAATALLLLLVLTAGNGTRRRLWRSHRTFQAVHVTLSCTLLVLIGVHVITTDRYAGGLARRGVLIAVTAGTLLMLLRARRGADHAPRSAWRQRLVFGRHSTSILIVVGLAVFTLVALSGDRARAALREPLRTPTGILPLDFPHEKHGLVNCLACHHNYADGTGLDWCIHCHRSGRSDLREGAEARFHGFCFECHRHPAATLRGHGPVSGCGVCHQASHRAAGPALPPPS